ncbi:MAG: hypothetical protein ACLP3K_11490 [Candidatus Acidiferrales bacterium]
MPRGKKPADLAGKRFGRLVAHARTATSFPDRVPLWQCRCDCGRVKLVKSQNLLTANTQSCGCLARDMVRHMRLTHGQSATKLYKVYMSAKYRCTNSDSKEWKDYGGGGIEFRFESLPTSPWRSAPSPGRDGA